jgi:hypothetical protein
MMTKHRSPRSRSSDSVPAGAEVKVTESHQHVLREIFYRPRQPYQRPTPQEEEAILALFAINDNLHEVERLTGWSRDIIRRVVRGAEEVGVLHERRLEHREQYVAKAWDVLMLALATIHDGLKRGYVMGHKLNPETGGEVHLVSTVRPGEAAAVVQKLHQTVRLHESQKPDPIQQIADHMSAEEIMEEAARLYAQIQERTGKLT